MTEYSYMTVRWEDEMHILRLAHKLNISMEEYVHRLIVLHQRVAEFASDEVMSSSITMALRESGLEGVKP